MNYTTNYNLKKPTDSDMYDVADFSGNMDLIDEQLKTNADDITDVEKPTFEDYTNPETEVPDADTAMAAIKSKTSIGVLFQNIKAFFKGAITIGKLVDNCTSTSTDLGLTANQGKVLMDRILGVEEDVSELNADVLFTTTEYTSVADIVANTPANVFPIYGSLDAHPLAEFSGAGWAGKGFLTGIIAKQNDNAYFLACVLLSEKKGMLAQGDQNSKNFNQYIEVS